MLLLLSRGVEDGRCCCCCAGDVGDDAPIAVVDELFVGEAKLRLEPRAEEGLSKSMLRLFLFADLVPGLAPLLMGEILSNCAETSGDWCRADFIGSSMKSSVTGAAGAEEDVGGGEDAEVDLIPGVTISIVRSSDESKYSVCVSMLMPCFGRKHVEHALPMFDGEFVRDSATNHCHQMNSDSEEQNISRR